MSEDTTQATAAEDRVYRKEPLELKRWRRYTADANERRLILLDLKGLQIDLDHAYAWRELMAHPWFDGAMRLSCDARIDALNTEHRRLEGLLKKQVASPNTRAPRRKLEGPPPPKRRAAGPFPHDPQTVRVQVETPGPSKEQT